VKVQFQSKNNKENEKDLVTLFHKIYKIMQERGSSLTKMTMKITSWIVCSKNHDRVWIKPGCKYSDFCCVTPRLV